jgi:hypothetical protein
MKQTILILLLLFGVLRTFSQNTVPLVVDTIKDNRKYVIWYSPSQATQMYGIMLNFWPKDNMFKKVSYPKIYGVELNVMPIGLFMPFVLAIHSIVPETHQPLAENIDSIDFNSFKKINGIQIGLFNIEPTIICGLDINVSGSFSSKSNGLTISAVMNKHHVVNGLTFAIIGNHDTKCNGVQIGLINTCKELRGIQIGLWNKNQYRWLPIINWNLKK